MAGGDLEQTGIHREHPAGDVGKPADHQAVQLAPRHPRQVGTDDKRCLRLAHEDVGGGGQGLAAAGAHDPPHHPGHAPDHDLEDAVVVQQGGDGRDEDDRAGDGDDEDEEEILDLRPRINGFDMLVSFHTLSPINTLAASTSFLFFLLRLP